MALNYLKQKASGFSKLSSKIVGMEKQRRVSSPSLPKMTTKRAKFPKGFSFSKFTKVAKLPKMKKVTALKASVEKATKKKYALKF